jgi:diguanylate cyclase (GGDEF)-like protein
MIHQHCDQFGFNAEKIAERLALLDLTKQDYAWSELLHNNIITPNASHIADVFYDKLTKYEEFNQILNRGYTLSHLKHIQILYLLSLGVEFDTPEYFEERLRVGFTHARVGVPPGLYQCAYRILQQSLIDHIPPDIRNKKKRYDGLVAFILKITMLDMSLAIDTYHTKKIRNLERSLRRLRDVGAELRHKVATDTLTGVASHGQTLSLLRQSLNIAHRNNTEICISMVDLDHFKMINDTYGHLVGDDVLRDVVARMESAVRDFDTIGRYGGEEFIIILENTSLDIAREIAERVRRNICDSPLMVNDVTVRMSISQGLADAHNNDDTNSLIKRADTALYQAKVAGRNCIKVVGMKEKEHKSG